MLDISSCKSRESFSKLFIATLSNATAGGRHNLVTVFGDWLETATLSLGNVFLKDPAIELRYQKIAERYGSAFNEFPKLFAITVAALEFLGDDFLGHVYMSQEMGNDDAGQFFTPDCISKVISEMTFEKSLMREAVERKGYFSAYDPACGGGVMLIHAFNQVKSFKEFGSRDFYVEGWDLDFRCVCMTYIQLSLLGVPAVVRHMNTLKVEQYSAWGTPLYYMHNFPFRLSRDRESTQEKAETVGVTPAVQDVSKPAQQMLFDIGA